MDAMQGNVNVMLWGGVAIAADDREADRASGRGWNKFKLMHAYKKPT